MGAPPLKLAHLPWRIRYRMVRSDRTVISVDRTSRAYFDEHGKLLRIVGMIADITDRLKYGSGSKWDGKPKYCSWYA